MRSYFIIDTSDTCLIKMITIKYPKRYDNFKVNIDRLDRNPEHFKAKLDQANNMSICINNSEMINRHDIQVMLKWLNLDSKVHVNNTITVDLPTKIESSVDIFGYFGTEEVENLLANKEFDRIMIIYAPMEIYATDRIQFWKSLYKHTKDGGLVYLMYNNSLFHNMNNFIDIISNSIGFKAIDAHKKRLHFIHHISGELETIEPIILILQK